jgi:hypothetical protein
MFSVYRSIFLVYRSIFFPVFYFFKISQKLIFLNCNQPVFDELNKPESIDFFSFQNNRVVFINI